MPEHHREQRRAVLEEGRVLLHYVLCAPPPWGLLRRYCRVFESEPPLKLPRLVRWSPALLRIVEPIGKGGGSQCGRLRERLNSAMVIADSASAARLYSYLRRSAFRTLIVLASIAIVEVVLLPMRLMSGGLWKS